MDSVTNITKNIKTGTIVPIKMQNIFLFVNMSDKSGSNIDSTGKEELARVFLLDKLICNFINEEWILKNKSNLSQSQELGIHPHVLRKIRENDGYRIPMSTLAIICFYKKIKLSDFFISIEKKYGTKINDDFISKTKK